MHKCDNYKMCIFNSFILYNNFIFNYIAYMGIYSRFIKNHYKKLPSILCHCDKCTFVNVNQFSYNNSIKCQHIGYIIYITVKPKCKRVFAMGAAINLIDSGAFIAECVLMF